MGWPLSSLIRGLPTLWSHSDNEHSESLCTIYSMKWQKNLPNHIFAFLKSAKAPNLTKSHCVSLGIIMTHSALFITHMCDNNVGGPLPREDACSQYIRVCTASQIGRDAVLVTFRHDPPLLFDLHVDPGTDPNFAIQFWAEAFDAAIKLHSLKLQLPGLNA